MLYYGAMDGYEHAISMADGKEVCKFYSGDTSETAYNTYPMGSGPIVAGGIVYCGVGEHSPTHPLYRGGKLFALDQVTGKLLWEMNGYFSVSAIADGYLLAQNQYDNQIYCFGKGPSATTVSAPQVGIATGSSVVISGTVTDESSGQKGTPAISDKDMGTYMAYLKEQQPINLANVAGVPVTLTAKAPDGSTVNIGSVTSDASGYFSTAWAPTSAGMYRITASFGSTDSYGSSSAETSLYAVAGQGSQVSTVAVTSNTDMYIVISTVIIVIAVVAAAVFIRGKK